MNLKFHWRLLHGGETMGATRAAGNLSHSTALPDLENQTEFCRQAEVCGITGLLTNVGAPQPDPILLAAALGMRTEKIEFIVAYRSGLIPPTTFVQQLNTLSALINGRFSLNIVAGHSPLEQRYYGDFLEHDERYARTEEFLAVCHRFWEGAGPVNFPGRYYRIENGQLGTPFVSPSRTYPELFIGGGSEAAKELAISQGSVWMRLADAPERLESSIQPVLAAGKEVGLRMCVICRSTREEAVRAALQLVSGLDLGKNDKALERDFMRKSDSVSIRQAYELADTEWLTPWLWTGAVRTHGGPAITVVGSPEEVASAFIEYKKIGVTQFILAGWPKLEEMQIFGREVLPRIRAKEREMENTVNGHDYEHSNRREPFHAVPA